MDLTELLLDRRAMFVKRWHHRPARQQESVAEHQWAVAFIAYVLAYELDQEGVLGLNPLAIMAMGMMHDMPEVVTGDLPHPFKERPGVRELWDEVEAGVTDELFRGAGASLGDELRYLVRAGTTDTEAARIVHVADKIGAYAFARQELAQGNTLFEPIVGHTARFLLGQIDRLDCNVVFLLVFSGLIEELTVDALRA